MDEDEGKIVNLIFANFVHFYFLCTIKIKKNKFISFVLYGVYLRTYTIRVTQKLVLKTSQLGW